MIAIFMLLMRYALVVPILLMQEKQIFLSNVDFALICIGCVLIAAGGYIINDIEDYKIDAINKPGKNPINDSISIENGFNYYTMITILGVVLVYFVSYTKEVKFIGMSSVLVAGLLYFYSTTYKCIPLLGNFIVSTITAALPLWVILPEVYALQDQAIMSVVGGYMIFAWLCSMNREILKDIEDLNGDENYSCLTLASWKGVKFSKVICSSISAIIIVLLIAIQVISRQWYALPSFLYTTILIDIPLLMLIVKTIKSKNKEDFRYCAMLSKFIMFTGILSMLVFYFSI